MLRLYLTAAVILFSVPPGFAAYRSQWQTLSSGGGNSSSSGYSNTAAAIGQFTAGKSVAAGSFSRIYAGYVSEYSEIEDVKLVFYDPSPDVSDISGSMNVKCAITVEAYNNPLATSTIRYSISNSGPGSSSFGAWRSGAGIEKTYNSKKVRFSVTIPTSTAGGESFLPGNSNYIQWRCYDTGGNQAFSGAYNVKIAQIGIEIVQPVDFTSTKPVFEVNFEGPVSGNTISIDVDRIAGGDVIELNGPEGLDSNTGNFKRRWTGGGFEPGQKYSMFVTAQDASGNIYSASSEFEVNKGFVADLIPVPSPFNPSQEDVTIRYVLEDDADVSIAIYNMLGELVKVVANKDRRYAGLNTQDRWSGDSYAGENLANGIYFCEIIAETASDEYRRYISMAVLR